MTDRKEEEKLIEKAVRQGRCPIPSFHKERRTDELAEEIAYAADKFTCLHRGIDEVRTEHLTDNLVQRGCYLKRVKDMAKEFENLIYYIP